MSAARPAVFLDRDGTMVHDAGYLGRLDDLRWYPWTIDAIRLLNRAGFLVFVVTNQGGIGLGLFTAAFVDTLHAAMADVLGAGGAHVDGWFYCPHHPQSESPVLREDCLCRKPGPGLVRQAEAAFTLDLARSFVVGDKMSDVELGTGVGARGILVRTGYGEAIAQERGGTVPEAAFVAADLMEATAWLLAESRSGERS
jgi:D-glycero-D-manno-heptose 1,7-bisphosphate phosphatase